MKRILVVKPSSLGDILHAFPAVSLLCEALPGVKIDWLVHPAFAQLLAYIPCVDRAILFRRSELGKASTFLPAMKELAKEIRKEPYDAVIDLQGLLRSALVGFLARSPVRAGHSKPKESLAKLFYTEAISVPNSISHAADRNTALVCAFLGRPFESRDATLPPNAKNMEGANKALLEAAGSTPAKPLVGIIPGARWETKRWPPSFFAKTACEMTKAMPSLSFVVLGAKSDVKMAQEIAFAAGKGAKVFSLAGKTSIGELVETLRLCSVAISNDSGPMHIAASVGTPLLALFGPTEPSLTGPRSGKAVVLRPDLDCIGCMKRYCEKGLCHISLDPKNAAGAALDLLRWRN